VQDKAPSGCQQAAFRIGAAFGTVWHYRIPLNWPMEARFDGKNSLAANPFVIGLNRHKNKDGSAGGRARAWHKKQIAAAHLVELRPDIHADVNLAQMTKAINDRVGNVDKVDRDTVREALKMLREKNPR